jgi:putative endopeptidase
MKLKPYPIKTQLVLVSSILLLGAFNTSEKSDLLLSGINKENMDTSAKPGDNFDAYVNGTWKKKH